MKQKSALILAALLVASIFSGGSLAQTQPPKTVMNFLAVMDLRCGSDIEKDQCAALTDVLIDELVRIKKYTVIDRANRDKILAEVGFQQGGCVDESCTIEAGRQLGVGRLVVGSVTKMGKSHLVNLQLLNVETAAVETSSREKCEQCEIDDLIDAVSLAGRKLLGVEEEPQPAPAVEPPANQYSVPTISTSKLVSAGLIAEYDNTMAMVVIYRPENKTAAKQSAAIYDFTVPVGKIRNGEWFYLEVAPGAHDYGVGKKYKSAYVMLSAGQSVFIRVEPVTVMSNSIDDFATPSAMAAIVALSLGIVEPNVGLMEIKYCEYQQGSE